MMNTIFLGVPLNLDYLGVKSGSFWKGDLNFSKIGLAMGVTNGGAAAKIGKSIYLLVIMRVGLLKKVGLKTSQIILDSKKGNGYE